MNFGIISKALGLLLLTESACMLPSMGVALYYGQGDARALTLSMILTAAAGLLLLGLSALRPKKGIIRYKEGFMITGFGWVLACAFGALPFCFSGSVPTYMDAYFETVSGFTTTGSTILSDVEAVPRGILFWRSFTHWLGGMGILAFTMALLPSMGGRVGTLQVYKAETTGPIAGKVRPTMRGTAKMLYLVYGIITVAQIISLRIAGMPVYDSLVHTFGTVGTGGFSIYNKSIGHYHNPSYEWIITIFTFVSGVNFSLYCNALHGNFRTLLKDREFQAYSGIVLGAIVMIAININSSVFHNVSESIRHASFQVMTIMSTTGYSSTNFDLWPDFSRMILMLLMFIGSCAGSTAGGIKVIRFVLSFKIIKRGFRRLVHPKAVMPVQLGGQTVPEETLQGVTSFIVLYLVIYFVAVLALLAQGMDMMSGASAVAATLNNVGPGFAAVGPMKNFSKLSLFSKGLLSVCMLLGRLEIHSLMILVMPHFWKK